MLLIIGLGNPGKEYANTRHNFGFMVVDAMASSLGLTWTTNKKFRADVAEMPKNHSHDSVWLVKPTTFMNLSGESVGAVTQFHKVEPKNIWVIADDLDLPLGKIRVRHGGESGGHRGLESIEQHLNSQDFTRIRLGIRGSEVRQYHLDNNIDTTSFVTRNFEDREKPMADRTVQYTVDLLKHALETGELKGHTYEVDGFDSRAAAQ